MADGKISGSGFGDSGSGCLRLPLVAAYNRGFRLGDKDKIASLGSKVSAPLCVTRVFGAVSTEAILAADVVLDSVETERSKTLTFGLGLGVGSSCGEARDSKDSKDGRMHFEYLDRRRRVEIIDSWKQ